MNRISTQTGFRKDLVEYLFPLLLLISLCGFTYVGYSLHHRKIAAPEKKIVSHMQHAQVYIREKPEEKQLKPRVEKKKEKMVVAKPKPKPVNLTDDPALKKKQDFKAEKSAGPSSRKARPVYGLRKVYSRGLGARGSMADAVVGKIGNTLDKGFDTLTATQKDIMGDIVSTTTVTEAPRFRKKIRPEYSEQMLAQKIQGVVRVKVLVDIDGKVKKALALNDLGADAADQALKASLAMEFEPAKRGISPVAVWIVVPIRFVMIG